MSMMPGNSLHPKLTRRSKYYVAGESWTKKPAWAFEIPLEVVEAAIGEVELTCQVPGDNGRYTLLVPASYLQLHESELYLRRDRNSISIFLSAVSGSTFIDQRGTGGVPFGQFLVP